MAGDQCRVSQDAADERVDGRTGVHVHLRYPQSGRGPVHGTQRRSRGRGGVRMGAGLYTLAVTAVVLVAAALVLALETMMRSGARGWAPRWRDTGCWQGSAE